MNVLFLAPYPIDQAPSQRYRFEQYLGRLSENKISFSYHPFLSLRAWNYFFSDGNYLKKAFAVGSGFLRRWILMLTLSKYDYIYIHREAAPAGPPIFEWIIAKVWKKKIIYDFDDAIWIPAVSQSNRLAQFIKCPTKVASVCKMAYKVSTGNSFLADFASKYCKNVIVIPTVVDTDKKHYKLQNHDVANPTIGWTGTFSTLKYLDIILQSVQFLQTKYDFTFIVICNKDPQLPLKNYKFIPWRRETEVEDLLSIHIGVMPLLEGDIEKGKCGFKAIQYLSLGIPAVVSPVGVNPGIVDHGINGFIASKKNEWEESISRLYENSSLRRQFGIAGRKKIESYFSVNSSFKTFYELFD